MLRVGNKWRLLWSGFQRAAGWRILPILLHGNAKHAKTGTCQSKIHNADRQQYHYLRIETRIC